MQLASDFLSGGGGGGGRSERIVCTASNPSIAVPSWARAVIISGCGGGGGGSGWNSGGAHGGSPGSAAAYAVRHPLLIPQGASTMAVSIGAGGSGGAVAASGGDGGDTTLVWLGVTALRLRGGLGGGVGSNNIGPVGGLPNLYDAEFPLRIPSSDMATGVTYPGVLATMLKTHAAAALGTLFAGMGGYRSSASGVTSNHNSSDGFTPCPFGGSGIGYGYGGRRATSPSGSEASGAAGGPGILLLEFVEGF